MDECDFEVVSRICQPSTSLALYSHRHAHAITANPFHVLPTRSANIVLPYPASFTSTSRIDCMQLSSDERHLAASTGEIIKIIDLEKGRDARSSLVNHSLGVTALQCNPRCPYAWYSGGLDSRCTIWDIRQNPASLTTLQCTGGPIRALAVSPDGRLLAIGSDAALQIYDMRNRNSMLAQFRASARHVHFNPAEMTFCVVGNDKLLKVYGLDEMDIINVSHPLDEEPKSIAVDENLIFMISEKTLRVYCWESSDMLCEISLPDCQKALHVCYAFETGVTVLLRTNNSSLIQVNYSLEELLSRRSFSEDEASGDVAAAESATTSKDNEFTVEFIQLPKERTTYKEEEKKAEDLISPSEEDVVLETTQNINIQDGLSPSTSSGTTSPVSEDSAGSSSSDIHKSVKSASSSAKNTPLIARKIENSKSKPTMAKGRSLSSTPSKSAKSSSSKVEASSKRTSSTERRRKPKDLKAAKEKEKETSKTQKPNKSTRSPVLNLAVQKSLSRSSSAEGSSSNAGTPVTNAPVEKASNSRIHIPDDHLLQLVKCDNRKVIENSKRRVIDLNKMMGISSGSSSSPIGPSSRKLHSSNQPVASGGSLLAATELTDVDPFMQPIHTINMRRGWGLQELNSFIAVIKVGLRYQQRRPVALAALAQIADPEFIQKLSRFSQMTPSIGVDVAAEDRQKMASQCAKELRELCHQREEYYKGMNPDDVMRFDMLLEQIKRV